MSDMNDLDLRLKKFDECCNRMNEAAVEGHKLVQAIRQNLTSNKDSKPAGVLPKRDSVQDKITVRQILAGKCQKGYTKQVKELLHKFNAEKLSDVDPKNYENLYHRAKEIGQ